MWKPNFFPYMIMPATTHAGTSMLYTPRGLISIFLPCVLSRARCRETDQNAPKTFQQQKQVLNNSSKDPLEACAIPKLRNS